MKISNEVCTRNEKGWVNLKIPAWPWSKSLCKLHIGKGGGGKKTCSLHNVYLQRDFSSPLALLRVSYIPPSLYAAKYTTKKRNMLFIHTIGYISSGRATRRRLARVVRLRGIAHPDLNGFRITRQSEWTECIITCADIVRPAAQLCSCDGCQLSSCVLSFVFPHFRARAVFALSHLDRRF